MIEKLDDSVGRICQVIKTLGIADRTIVIFYSDNRGSEPVTDNYPLNGGKGMPYEGGSRVPLIIRWTGKIEGGIRSSVPITGVDFYPTFVTLAQGKIPANLDGKDIFTLINNNETERDLFWHFPAYLESYLNGGRDFRAKPYSSIRAIRNMIFGETIRSLPGFLLSWVPVIRTLLPAVMAGTSLQKNLWVNMRAVTNVRI